MKKLPPTGALAIAGGDEYNLDFLFAIQLQSQLDVNNLAFVHIFIFGNSIRLRFGQTIFKCPAIANALPLAETLFEIQN